VIFKLVSFPDTETRDAFHDGLVSFAGGRYLRVPLGESEDQPSGLMTLWLVLIALSSLARYEPAGWTRALAPTSPLAVPIEQGLRHATLRIPFLVSDVLA
jgi:hypothetical protein